MGTNAALRLRRSAAQLHALAEVEREIRATDPKGRCRYLRDYAEAFPAYESVLSDQQLGSSLAEADIILVGDYHALPASQRYVNRLLERLAGESGRPLVLGLEAIFARHQHVLDEWMRGEIDEAELRERVRFDLDWGYEWAPYREVLDAGRRCAQRIYGLDCTPRDLRRIAVRDRHAATKIREIRERHPEAIIVVLFGESHLAPNHLPALLRDNAGDAPHPSGVGRVLTILQNVDTLYWQAAGERCDRVEAVRVRDGVVCVFNSTPLDKYESYRLCLDRWRRMGGAAPDLAPSIYNLIDALLRFLNIDKYSPTNRVQPKFLVDLLPEVWFRASSEQLERLLLRKGMTAAETAKILERVGERGACHVASVNAVFATSFRVEHGAEEAARFVHHACQGTLLRGSTETPLSPEDRFYARVLREALAYFGSRVLCPARPPVRESDLYALYALPQEAIEQQSLYSCREFMLMVDFLVQHKDYEKNYRHYRGVPELLRKGLRYSGGEMEFVSEKLGQMLGTELYDAYLNGAVKKRFLRSLFMRTLEKPGAARAAYYAVARRISKPGCSVRR
jgi:hypothetical protein